MTIDESTRNDMTIVALTGRLDSTTAGAAEQRLLEHAARPAVTLVLDLSRLDYISSAGLRVVLLTAKRAQASQGKFILCGLTDQVRTIFEVSGFLTILRVVGNCDQAAVGAP